MRETDSVTIYPAKAELVEAAADRFLETVRRSLDGRGGCFIALAGGSTPRDLYARLAVRSREAGQCWDGVHLFWGDERAVAPDSPQSNYRMVKESLLDQIDIPPTNVHRIRGEVSAEQAAAEYAQVIQRTVPKGRSTVAGPPPRFDLVLLGVGEDGHTASLFAGTPVLEERLKYVSAVYVDKLQSWRITLTYPILNRSRQVVFLVSGSSKAGVIGRISALKAPSKEFPASLVQPEDGKLFWMLDQQAAQFIDNGREATE